MDSANKSLNHITESRDYVCIPNVVVFDEHDEFTPEGKLLRRFDRKKLEEIATRSNKREQLTGDLGVGGPGHTREDVASEEDQPPVWLYARNYRVGPYGPDNKLGLLCDYYVKRKITTNDGKVVDGPEYVKSFPRRSVELWPDSPHVPEHARLTIDWHALLRRAPQRDLGLLTYQRSPVVQKLRYEMEAVMSNPVEAPDKDVDTEENDEMPEGHEDFAKHLDYACKAHPALKYMMDQYAANCSQDGGDEEGVSRFQRTAEPTASKEIEKLRTQNAELQARAASAVHEARVLKYQRSLSDLREKEGFDIDVDVELGECTGLDEGEFQKHLTRIRRIAQYARTPVGGDLPSNAIETPSTDKDPLSNPAIADKVTRYAREKKYTGDDAFYKAARELGIIK